MTASDSSPSGFRDHNRVIVSAVVLLVLFSVVMFLPLRVPVEADPARYRITTSELALRDVPISTFEIELAENDLTHSVIITGLQPIGQKSATQTPVDFSESESVDLGFDAAAVASSDQVSGWVVTGEPIRIGPADHSEEVAVLTLWPGWVAILPPLVAILLAIWCRSVVPALLAGVGIGMWILTGTDVLQTTWGTTAGPFWSVLTDPSRVMVIAFTVMLGGMVRVMADSGGTAGLIRSLAFWTETRERTQTLTSGLGFAVFFDDYANTLFVGGTMRPVFDRLKISREKLAFLVDATAAPVAGLAIISTWVGVELSYIAASYESLGLDGEVYGLFVATIPYRFYPLLLLAFVFIVAGTGRDFGPMLDAERRAFRLQSDLRPEEQQENGDTKSPQPSAPLIASLGPIAVLLVSLIAGLVGTGWWGLRQVEGGLTQLSDASIFEKARLILDQALPNETLLLGASLAAIVALLTGVKYGALTVTAGFRSLGRGWLSMAPAILVLIFAWAIADLCASDRLNTAGYLIETLDGRVPANWWPLVAFLLAGLVAFATGSSWSTMGLVMPLCIAVQYVLLVEMNTDPANAAPMLAAIGAVLAGAIFGDHISPISDTTVLSSAASGCDHLAHVATQLPYALTVATVSLVCCYLPLGLGFGSPWITLPVGVAVCFCVVRVLGRRATEPSA